MRRWLGIAACLLTLWPAGCGKGGSDLPSQTEVTEFHAAVQEGDAAIVDRLLQAKPALVNTPDSSGRTPLKVAVSKGDDELADVLRKHGGKE